MMKKNINLMTFFTDSIDNFKLLLEIKKIEKETQLLTSNLHLKRIIGKDYGKLKK